MILPLQYLNNRKRNYKSTGRRGLFKEFTLQPKRLCKAPSTCLEDTEPTEPVESTHIPCRLLISSALQLMIVREMVIDPTEEERL